MELTKLARIKSLVSYRKLFLSITAMLIAVVLAYITAKIMPAFADRQLVTEAAGVKSAVAAADIDADGINEVVFSGSNGTLSVKKYNHNTRLTDPYPIYTTNLSAGVVAEVIRLKDINGDGKMEIIIGGPASTKVEAYSFANGVFTQVFSVSLSGNVLDLAVGQFTNINSNTGLDIAAVTSTNKLEIIYNNSGTWGVGVTANLSAQPQRIEGVNYGGQDGIVITLTNAITAYPFTSADNPAPVWTKTSLSYSGNTYSSFGPLAVSKDITLHNGTAVANGTDGVPEIVIGTRDQQNGVPDAVFCLNGATGDPVWAYSQAFYDYYYGSINMGRVNDIKIGSVSGSPTDAKRYIAVGTGTSRMADGTLTNDNKLLMFDLEGSGVNTPCLENYAASWGNGEVLALAIGKVDGGTSETNVSLITGGKVGETATDKGNNLIVATKSSQWTSTIGMPSFDYETMKYKLSQSDVYTWTPRSTYWLDTAAINRQDNFRDVAFVHPGAVGMQVMTFDDNRPTMVSATASPSPVTNPWNNNVTFNFTINEGAHVRTEILRGSNGAVFSDLGWKIADYDGTNATVSVVWNGKDGSGNNYNENSYKVRVTAVDNETQFDGNTPLTITEIQNVTTMIQTTYPGTYSYYSVTIDNTPPTLTMSYFTDAALTKPLPIYAGKPITKSNTDVYLKITSSEPLDYTAVRFAVTNVHAQGSKVADWVNGNNYKGVWNLSLPAADGEATVTAQTQDAGGNPGSVTGNILVDNTVSAPTMTTTNNVPKKVVLSISGMDADNKSIKIYRSTNPGFVPDDDINLLTTLNNPVPAEYEDYAVQPGLTYYYIAKQTDFIGNTAATTAISGKAVPALRFSADYYADAELTTLLPKNSEGEYFAKLQAPIYVKLTANNALSGVPVFRVDAPGSTVNDLPNPITNPAVATTNIAGNAYKGIWGVNATGADGKAYVKVTATDIYGQTITDSVPVSGGSIIIDTTALSPKLFGKPGPTSANLEWTKEANVEYTKIYRSANSDFIPVDSGEGANKIATSYGRIYHDSNLVHGQNYYYKVITVDYAGNTSQPSNQAAVNPDEAVPHSTPDLLKAMPTSKQIIYLYFDEPVQIQADPTTWVITQNLAGTPPTVYSAQTVDDRRAVKLVLNGGQSYGNLVNPLNYTITLTGVTDDYGIVLPENGTDNVVTWEAFSPHGKFAAWSGGNITAGSSTVKCGLCHAAHDSQGVHLLPKNTIKKVCFTCHGITGSSDYLVEGEFISRTADGGVVSVSLHKSLDSDLPGYDELSCVDCHNPHGDLINKNVDNRIYPKLLSVKDTDGTRYYKGNQVCLVCHGKDNRGFEDGNYYEATGGNHINPNSPTNINSSNVTGPVHYDNASFGAYLNPASGTENTCVKCHERHGSQYDKLIDNNGANAQEALCFKSGCHGPAETGPAKNIYNQFYGAGIVSRHDVRGETGRGNVECSNCHGPHTVDNAAGKKTTDPDNSKLFIAGNTVTYCLKCHDGDPPIKTTSSSVIVPYTVSFNDIITSNGNGWNKKLFTNSGHSKSGFSVANCATCHIVHGSTRPWLIRYDDAETTYALSFDGSTATCLGLCHVFDVGGTANTDIKTPYSATYKHPTFTVNGVHSNSENWEAGNVTRHAECSDCHDFHDGYDDGSEIGVNGSINGVRINNWNGLGWSNWNSDSPGWELAKITKQYQLCLKCHSKFSYTSPPVTPSSSAAGFWSTPFNQTDLAMEFSPNNGAYHAVIGASKVAEYVYEDTTYSYGKYVGSWDADSSMTCTNCHSYSASYQGPHGSPYRFILIKNWNNNTGKAGTSNDLCFSCHDYDFYTGANPGSQTQRSQFSGWGKSGPDDVYVYNMHNTQHAAVGCTACHSQMIHGWGAEDTAGNGLALHVSSDPRPYSDGVALTSFSGSNVPGAWRSHTSTNPTCTSSCHG